MISGDPVSNEAPSLREIEQAKAVIMKPLTRRHRELPILLGFFLLQLLFHTGAQPTPQVTVRGRVISDIANQPIARARLTLSSERLNEPLTAYTDDHGAYVFKEVPVGKYSLSIERAGYFPLTGVNAVEVVAERPPDSDAGDQVMVAIRVISGSVR